MIDSTLINSDEFKKELTNIIESSVDTDWFFDGSQEFIYQSFSTEEAVKLIVFLLNDKLDK